MPRERWRRIKAARVIGPIFSSVFEKTKLSCALQPDRTQPELASIANQLNLFEI